MKQFYLLIVMSILLFGCATIPPQVSEFKAMPNSIEEGGKVTLYWNVTGADQVSISEIGENLEPVGSREVYPTKTKTFNLIATKGSEQVRNSVSVNVEAKKVETKKEQVKQTNTNNEDKITTKPTYINSQTKNYPYSQGVDDGRFTLGTFISDTQYKRAMFGFPMQFSTSHFIVSVNGKLASNNPNFKNDPNVKYISTKRIITGETCSIHSAAAFEFEGVKIIQTLTPVDSKYSPVKPNSWGQHYQIKYELINQRDDDVVVGIMELIDTMIDENDACKMTADNTKVDKEVEFTGANVPKEILVYRTNYDKKDMHTIVTLGVKNNNKPDKVYIGSWPYFHGVKWDVVPSGSDYFDSAILMKWENKKLKSLDSTSFVMYYGNPDFKLKLMHNTPMEVKSTVLYFKSGSNEIDEKGKNDIKALVQNKKISGAVVEGYSDAVGNDAINMNVSKKRTESVKSYLSTFKGVDKHSIIPKVYGETRANQSAEAQKTGDERDRRVEVFIYLEDK